MMIRWWEHSQQGKSKRCDGQTDRQTDGQMDRQTENTICRAAWSQLKIMWKKVPKNNSYNIHIYVYTYIYEMSSKQHSYFATLDFVFPPFRPMPRIITLSTLVGEYWRHLPHVHYTSIYTFVDHPYYLVSKYSANTAFIMPLTEAISIISPQQVNNPTEFYFVFPPPPFSEFKSSYD